MFVRKYNPNIGDYISCGRLIIASTENGFAPIDPCSEYERIIAAQKQHKKIFNIFVYFVLTKKNLWCIIKTDV